MMFVGNMLTVTHVSMHIPLEQAIVHVNKERILQVIQMTYQALSPICDNPRIAVAGLNPHAGEGGAFGMQEITEITPAIELALAEGINVSGPFSPDTVFLRASNGEFDAVVCMYHDQGHIPLKLLNFGFGVNVTLGLQIVRTSVDHGTAYDIAYQGIASTGSLVTAFEYTKKLCQIAR